MSTKEIRPYEIRFKNRPEVVPVFTSDNAAELFTSAAEDTFSLKCQGMIVFSCDTKEIHSIIDIKSSRSHGKDFIEWCEVNLEPKVKLIK